MKITRLETHDRYEHFTKQDFDIGKCCQDLIDKRPFGNNAFYIFAHTRTDEDGTTKRLIWQPRLSKPTAQTNSMLFKAYPGTDSIKVIWMIPAREMWDQYRSGNITESHIVSKSIESFKHLKQIEYLKSIGELPLDHFEYNELEEKEKDDLNDEQIDQIYRDLSLQAKHDKAMDKMYLKPETSEAF